ncbi:MAG: PASTA domain-containing protein [Fidelibacterota bacterium]
MRFFKHILIFLSTGIFFVLFINYLLMPTYINQRSMIAIPNLEGLSVVEAESITKSEGIEVVVVDTIFTNDINPGIILEQFPAAGKEVKIGRAIKIKITQLNQKIVVPELLGKTLRSSEIELDQIGISVDSVYYSYSPNYPKGIVSWQSPAPLDSIRKGFGVRIEVSTGLAPNDFIAVPDLQGIFYSEAIKKINELGLKEGSIQFVVQNKFLPNTVLNQNPKEGTKVSQDSSINLIISK